jgi:hypothetical protein
MRGPNVDYYNSGLSKIKQNHFGKKKKCFMKLLVHIYMGNNKKYICMSFKIDLKLNLKRVYKQSWGLKCWHPCNLLLDTLQMNYCQSKISHNGYLNRITSKVKTNFFISSATHSCDKYEKSSYIFIHLIVFLQEFLYVLFNFEYGFQDLI